MTNSSMRIAAIDGWRAIAALGVLWTHAWAVTKFHSFSLLKIDIYKAINIVGNGVQLFFVISGFCMYMILYKQFKLSTANFFQFIKRRFARIAPAFYFACIAIGLYNYFFFGEDFFRRLFYNFIFLQNLIPNAVISSPFWSLAVEWHFYIFLPFLFWAIHKIGFFRGTIIFSILCVLITAFHYNNIFLPGTQWWYDIFGNLNHFIWGILLCYVIINEKPMPAWLSSGLGFVISLGIASIGKIFFSKVCLDLTGNYQWIFLTIGPPLMTFGFSLLIYTSLKNRIVNAFIGNKYLSSLGRISYSFYLWHSFILMQVYEFTKSYLTYGGLDPVILFLLTLLLLLPASYLSYTLFEKFYFNKKLLQSDLIQDFL